MVSPTSTLAIPSSFNNPSATGNSNNYSLDADTNPDEIAQLLPLSLTGSTNTGSTYSTDTSFFPGILFKEDQSFSLAAHLFPNQDSGYIENMGRNPAHFNIRAMMTNNIYPSLNESWKPGTLFPNGFKTLINILLNNGPKVLNHPIYGQVNVQCVSWSYELNAKGPRDGAIVDMILIETLVSSGPDILNSAITVTPGSGHNNAANSLDNAVALLPAVLNPPGLSLTQIFGQINAAVQQAIAVPNNFVNGISQGIVNPVINGLGSVGGSLINAPAYLANNTIAAIQGTKDAVAGTTVSVVNAINNDTNISFNNLNLKNAVNPGTSSGVSYDQSTFNATQSLIALNYTPSQNAVQLMDKVQTVLVNFIQHYTNQNNAACSPVIEALRQYLFQIQQQQSALSQNAANQSAIITTYLTTNYITWQELCNITNNSVDQIMGLNQGLVNDFFIPGNTTINYYAQT